MLFSGSVFAQEVSEEDIIGVYKTKSNDPMGGSTIVFLPDHTYIIAYFGGVQKGTWELKSGKLKVTKTVEPQFVLYGRKTISLGEKIQVKVSTRSENLVLVGFEAKNTTKLKRLFNPNANCFLRPYLITQQKPVNQLNLALLEAYPNDNSKEGEKRARVFQFTNTESYNDLLVVNLPSGYTSPSTAQIRYKDGLLFENSFSEGLKKRPLESLSGEDLKFVTGYSDRNLLPQKLQYGDEFFPYSENPTSEELKPYLRIKPIEISEKPFILQSGSFLNATCEKN